MLVNNSIIQATLMFPPKVRGHLLGAGLVKAVWSVLRLKGSGLHLRDVILFLSSERLFER